ncbi:MAG: HAMP domain-containing protein [Planctomycetes bacterium]|nr:HAMP domain-containing protein [Planctomycetota bacterium]
MRLSIRWRLTLWNTLAVALVLLVFGGLQYALLRRALYQRIDRALQEQYDALEAGRKERLEHWVEEYWEHEKTFCVVYRPDGTVRAKTDVLNEQALPPPGQTETVRFDDLDLPIIRRHRVLVPMEQLRRATEEVTADRLDRRLPVANPGDELGRMARTINEMIGRLEKSFAEVRRFTADASHELRTPLTAIRTEAEVALGRPSLPPEQQHLLGSILEECERLTRLTDQLLALSREDAGVVPVSREELDLASLVEGVVETMRPLAEAKGLRLRTAVSGGVRVRADGARLRQVFYNLLDNAIKYTPEGGDIEARVEGREGEAVATIRDTGVGIPAEHLPRVFDRFYRVDRARSREQGGTGLGLSITRSIVHAHGGRVELDSAPGRGTTCTVTLPLAPAP